MKHGVRESLIRKRNLLTILQVEKRGDLIFSRLKELDEYRQAGSILVYASFGNEVVTDALIKDLLIHNKVVCTTKIGNKFLSVKQITSIGELTARKFGIRQPSPQAPDFDSQRLDLVIM